MATFKVTKGTPVAFRDSAYPTAYPSPYEGELFYNSSSGAFQFVGLGGGSWATGGNLNTGRKPDSGSDGIQTAAIVAGGYSGAGVAVVEKYNGSTWTEVGDLNEARYAGATFGTSSSAIHTGGHPYTGKTESWDNSSWTEVGDLNTARREIGRAGASNTSGLVAGGYIATGYQGIVETWNGASWTEVGDLNTARSGLSGTGVVTAALVAAGDTPPRTVNAEVWNGSSWTEVNNLNTGRFYGATTGVSSTDALLFGGLAAPGVTANTESWNGTSWTELNNLATARESIGGAGSGGSSALASGGNPITAATEEWSFAHPVKTIDVS